jgi:hypothetical protein
MVSMASTTELKYAPVTSKEMEDIIKSLKNKNSFGYDEISSKVQYALHTISTYLYV